MNLTQLKSNEASAEPATGAQAISVLVVEDERIIARGIEICLRRLGYRLAGSAANGPQAIAMAGELRPDVVLMDISLGAGMDGIEASDIIRREHNLPVVFLTANSDDATFRRAVCSDPFGYVRKPFEQKDLQTALEIAVYKHRTQRELRENQQWLAATLGGIADAVIALNEDGLVRFVNDRAVRMLGYHSEDLVGGHIDRVLVLHDETKQSRIRCPLRPGQSRDGVPLPEVALLTDRHDHESIVELTLTEIHGHQGKTAGSVLVLRDITRRRSLEKQLRNAQKLDAIGRLAGGIAHDFNNIMTVINGFTQLLQDANIPSETRSGYVVEIAVASRKASDLVRQITAFGRRQILDPVNVSLNVLVRELGNLLNRLVGDHIEVVTRLNDEAGMVTVDPHQFGQVVINLAANARDAMPEGGTLKLTTSAVVIDDTAALAGELNAGVHSLLTITDTGRGIPPDQLDKIFEPFFTTKATGEGYGLGLSIVYGTIKQSGGHIEALSVPGEGATFKIYLPQITEDQSPPPDVKREGPSSVGSSDPSESARTVMVVDDETPVRRMIKLILQHEGYDVIDAVGPTEALAFLSTNPTAIDLLITDIVMPRMSGIELADRVREGRPGTRVLFLSGYSREHIERQGMRTASFELIQKPFQIEHFKGRVAAILAEGKAAAAGVRP